MSQTVLLLIRSTKVVGYCSIPYKEPPTGGLATSILLRCC